jgi:3-deoxy-D-manno-octulosonic-acid transferase
MMLPMYEGLMTLGGPIIDLFLARRVKRGKEDPARLPERRGIAGMARPEGELIWLHAASVGESMAALALISRMLAERQSRHILVTTGTVTSARMMAERLPPRAFHQYIPVDRPAWIDRFLDYWRPDLLLVMESEFWPGQIARTHARGIPIVLVNARMSDRSFSRWRRADFAARSLFSRVDLALATNPDQAARFTAFGARKVMAAGNLKRSASPLPLDRDEAAVLDGQCRGRQIWFAASTHGGEDEPVLDAHLAARGEAQNLLTIIAPRHPHRGEEIAALAGDRGLRSARRGIGQAIEPETDIYIADTLGEMALFFHLASIVFVAGSLVPVGGHNPLEPAHFDCAILLGPLMSKNQEPAREMTASDAVLSLKGAEELAPALAGLLQDEARRDYLAQNARRYVEEGQRVLDTVIAAIEPLLGAQDPRKTS